MSIIYQIKLGELGKYIEEYNLENCTIETDSQDILVFIGRNGVIKRINVFQNEEKEYQLGIANSEGIDLNKLTFKNELITVYRNTDKLINYIDDLHQKKESLKNMIIKESKDRDIRDLVEYAINKVKEINELTTPLNIQNFEKRITEEKGFECYKDLSRKMWDLSEYNQFNLDDVWELISKDYLDNSLKDIPISESKKSELRVILYDYGFEVSNYLTEDNLNQYLNKDRVNSGSDSKSDRNKLSLFKLKRRGIWHIGEGKSYCKKERWGNKGKKIGKKFSYSPDRSYADILETDKIPDELQDKLCKECVIIAYKEGKLKVDVNN